MLPIVDSLLARYRALRDVRARYPEVQAHYSSEIVGEGVLLGAGTQISRRSRLVNAPGGELLVGDHTWIGDDCTLGSGGRLFIGRRVSIQSRAQLFGDVEVGAGCICASDLYASSGSHAFALRPELPLRVQDRLQQRQSWPERSRPIVIGEDCWIGVHVVITPGVTIGRGCVIGANSVVTRDLAPYSVAAGSPARVLHQRLAFTPPQSIDASRDLDLPYFYAGFRQLGDREEDDDAVPRRDGGLVTEASFTLALAPGPTLALDVHAVSGGELLHDGARQSIARGRATLRVHRGTDQRGLSHFSFRGNREHELAVVSARVE